ncbi:Hypothetical protein, putative, partial [Bodo saltans]
FTNDGKTEQALWMKDLATTLAAGSAVPVQRATTQQPLPMTVMGVEEAVSAARQVVELPAPRAKRASYTYTQKIQALRDLAGSSCSLISQRTGIPITTLKTWRAQAKAIRDAIARGWGRFHREPEPRTYKNLYEHLYKMFVATREVLLVVNCAVVCMWADKFSQDFRGLGEQSKKDIICRWRKYYGITRRRRTHTAQLLPTDVEARMKGFFAMLRGHKGVHVIVCGDETFLLTEATGDHTYAIKGSKSVAIRNFCEKKGCTVMLSSAAYKDVDGVWGQKTIPPMVIWKATPGATVAKNVRKEQKYGYKHPYVAEVSENGWMDASNDDVIEIDDEVDPVKVHEVSDDEDDSDVTCLFDCLSV